MAGLSFECDWRFAMNVSGRQKARAGYLLSWSGVGGLNLAADLTVRNPHTSTGASSLTGPTVKCVGLIEKFSFAGGQEDPIRIVAYVTTGTAAALRVKLASGITTTKFTFSFAICDFDLDARKWFESAFVQGKAKAAGVVDTTDGILQLLIDATPTRVNPDLDLVLCRMEFQAAASDATSVNLQFATGAGERVVKAWGGEDGA